jgi:hypothetical protein
MARVSYHRPLPQIIVQVVDPQVVVQQFTILPAKHDQKSILFQVYHSSHLHRFWIVERVWVNLLPIRVFHIKCPKILQSCLYFVRTCYSRIRINKFLRHAALNRDVVRRITGQANHVAPTRPPRGTARSSCVPTRLRQTQTNSGVLRWILRLLHLLCVLLILEQTVFCLHIQSHLRTIP